MLLSLDQRPDYKVDFLREETVADRAWSDRVEAQNQFSGYFNVASFISNDLSRDPKRGPILIVHDNCGSDPIAFVTFEAQRVLHIYCDAWEEMNHGEPECREIGAHEAGHLVLHNGRAKSFSSDPNLKIKFAEAEYSSESQANWYMDHLLLPRRILEAVDDVEALIAFSLRREFVERRLKSIRPKAPLRIRSPGDACPRCGNYLLESASLNLRCGVCTAVVPRFSI